MSCQAEKGKNQRQHTMDGITCRNDRNGADKRQEPQSVKEVAGSREVLQIVEKRINLIHNLFLTY